MSDLQYEIERLLSPDQCSAASILSSYKNRLAQGNLLRDGNPVSHFCVYSLPFNKKQKSVYMIHHRKSGLWLFPGGHIENRETLSEAVNRELHEELGVTNVHLRRPFLFTITNIINPRQTCREHFDIWYFFETSLNKFSYDKREFTDAQWMTVSHAGILISDSNTRLALKIVSLRMSDS